MPRILMLLLCVLTAGPLLVISGCRAGEGVTNVMGSYETYVAATPDEVAEAAVDTVEDLQLVLIEKSATKLDALVVARTAQDEPVRIKINREGNNVSKVAVRVGTVADEEISLEVIEGIKSRL